MTECISRTVEGMDGSKSGVVVRTIASRQSALGSNPGVDAICGLSLFLVLFLAPRGFFPGTPVSLLLKNQHFQIPIRPGIRETKNHLADVLPINCCLLFIILYNS